MLSLSNTAYGIGGDELLDSVYYMWKQTDNH